MDSTFADARILTDRHGQTWIVLRSAEETYLEVMRRLHPDITPEQARAEWPELIEHVQRVGPQDARLDRWRASTDFDRVCLLVEPTAEGPRVHEVLAREHGAGPSM